MGACRVLVYVSAAYGARSEPGRTLLVACAVLLSYLIGLTYVAKQENLTEFRNLWPLLFLFAPFAVGARAFGSGALVPLLYVAFLGWVLYAVSLLRRRKPGNIPRAVVSLIAGISLSDAMLLAACGHTRAAALAVACFFATLFLQRFVSGT